MTWYNFVLLCRLAWTNVLTSWSEFLAKLKEFQAVRRKDWPLHQRWGFATLLHMLNRPLFFRERLFVLLIRCDMYVDNNSEFNGKCCHFYSAPQCSHCKRCNLLATAIPSVCLSVCLSVRPSVTRRYCVKTTARSTVQFALSDSKMCPVL